MNTSNSIPSLARIAARLMPLQPTIDVLWSKLVSEENAAGPRSIGFMGSESQAGTTLMATCAGIGIARHLRANTLLIETNHYSPGLASYAEVPDAPGLVDVLRDDASLESAIRPTDVAGFSLLPVGRFSTVPPGFYSTESATELFEKLERMYDFALFDIAPVLEHTDAHALLRRMDDACLVVRAGSSTNSSVEKAAREIEDDGIPLLGTVLNAYKPEFPAFLGGRRAA